MSRLTRIPAALACALMLLAAPARAWAHGGLQRSVPAAGAHLAALPRELRLTFTEAPALAFTRLQLLDAAGREVALGVLTTATPRTVVSSIVGALAAGAYTVAWQMAGDDGHVTRGRFRFVIAPGAQGIAAPPPIAPAPHADSSLTPAAPVHHDPVSMPEGTTFGAESPLYVVIRWVQFVGLLGVVGAAAFAVCVLPRVHAGAAAAIVAQARARTARLALGATGVVALAAVLRLVAQSYAMHGPAQSFDAGLIGAMLTQTVWGRGWLLQLAAVIFAAFGFSAAARERRAGWALATLAVLALALTPALSGHAASAPRLTPLAIVADGLHVVGAGGWLGSLLFVLVVGIPAAARLTPQGVRGDAVADLVQAFSPTALAFAGLVTVTGLFAAWLHLGSVGALWESRYGTVLLVKLGALVVVVATGAYNWRRVRPALGDAAATARLRRSSTIELVVAVLVLGITAVLVATPTALDDAAMRRPSPTSDQLTGSRP